MGIAVYRYVIEILTPTIVTAPSGYRGMSYTLASNYIHGASVRGALFSSLMSERLVELQAAQKESLNPLHSVTPALYTPNPSAALYIDVAFAHCLTYSFKMGGEVYSLGIEALLEHAERERDVNRALHRILVDYILSVDRLSYRSGDVFRTSADTKRMLGEIIFRRDGGSWVRVRPRTSVYVENAVDRVRRSSAEGVLYAYEHIEPGSTFVGYIAVDERSKIHNALNSIVKSHVLVRIGRGIGRGYGLSRLVLHPFDTDKLYSITAEVRQGERVVVYFASPSVELKALPTVPAPRDTIVARVFGLEALSLEIEAVLGRATDVFYGWSYRTGSPKLPIKTLASGSLAVAVVQRIHNSDLVKHLPVAGYNHLSSQGYNIVLLLERDFIGRYKV